MEAEEGGVEGVGEGSRGGGKVACLLACPYSEAEFCFLDWF